MQNLKSGLTDNEITNVFEFYNSTASAFSNTKFNPWEKVKEFVESEIKSRSHQPVINLADFGCGNGRNSKFIHDNLNSNYISD